LIIDQGRVVLSAVDLEKTADDLVKKLGPEKAGTVRRCLESLLDEDTLEDLPQRPERRRELIQLLVDAFN